jgi:hypothetical protein
MVKLFLQLNKRRNHFLVLCVFVLSIRCKQRIKTSSSNSDSEGQVLLPPAQVPAQTQADLSKQNVSKAPAVKIALSADGLLKTEKSNYVNPMLTGVQTSDWCKCRNIGTSPHIGWDLGFGSSNRSIALANGVIRQKLLRSAPCGWEILFEDTSGAQWMYRHLNENDLSEGTALFQGALLGTHQKYPIVDKCGSGPHLHLERRTKGDFEGEEVAKNCGAGNSTCHFDPKSPLEGKRVLQTVSEANVLEAKAKKETETARSANEGSGSEKSLSLVQSESTDQNKNQLVQVNTKPIPCAFYQPEPLLLKEIALGSEKNGLEIGATVEEIKRDAERTLIKLSFESAEATNLKNLCDDHNCVVSWQLFSETSKGWHLSLEAQGLGNEPLSNILAESLYCWPENFNGNWKAKVTTVQNGRYVDSWLQGNTRESQ